MKFMDISAGLGLDIPSQSSQLSPSCRGVSLYIRPILADGVIGGSYWSLGSLLTRGSNVLEGLLCDDKKCTWKTSPYLLVLLYLEEEVIRGVLTFYTAGIYFCCRLLAYYV